MCRAWHVPQSLLRSSKAETAAKVSEQAERYKDMIKHVKAVRGAAGVVVVCNVLSRWPRGTCLGTPRCASSAMPRPRVALVPLPRAVSLTTRVVCVACALL